MSTTEAEKKELKSTKKNSTKRKHSRIDTAAVLAICLILDFKEEESSSRKMLIFSTRMTLSNWIYPL
jgi:hypothetical protein